MSIRFYRITGSLLHEAPSVLASGSFLTRYTFPMSSFTFHPVTPDRLADLDRFSRAHGKFRYCSCMRWRMPGAQYQKSTKEQRVVALEDRVRQSIPIGILAYLDGDPVGWCSVAPYATYVALQRYKALAPIDDTPVWSIVCFFVDAKVRRRGLTAGLLKAAVKYARSQGALVVEGYPVEPGSRLYTYMGSPAAFRKAGFQDVAPPERERRIMRCVVDKRALRKGTT